MVWVLGAGVVVFEGAGFRVPGSGMLGMRGDGGGWGLCGYEIAGWQGYGRVMVGLRTKSVTLRPELVTLINSVMLLGCIAAVEKQI